MKKAFLIAMVTGMTLPAVDAFASDGTIQFTGTIIADACTVDTSAGTSVSLGNVAATAFSAAGDKASPVPFSINLTSCPDTVDAVTVTFDGQSDSKNATLLSLDPAETAASGVAIEISDTHGNAIPLHSASAEYPIDTESGAGKLDFIGRYVSTAAKVSAGDANATTQFTINYQ